ncbi:YdcP family protein [Bacillus changyiensis]|uniref:YdcP family protein n=1 Tax=Bacillus changyiensis TaxID=3004103 RepID=UPI0022E8BA5B|nr:YdcP family protein [Bacillus changyiensis]MDA1478044.1 YdcP family protein [Bacillus changyiensis]
MKFNFIVPDTKATFGDLKFMGLNRERFVYEDGKRTDKLESRIYNLASSVQKGQIEVTLPAHIDLKEYEPFVDVELKTPQISAMAMSAGNFANLNWTVRAEDIVLKGAGSTSKATTTAGSNDKK